jgi:hypothetical protein
MYAKYVQNAYNLGRNGGLMRGNLEKVWMPGD